MKEHWCGIRIFVVTLSYFSASRFSLYMEISQLRKAEIIDLFAVKISLKISNIVLLFYIIDKAAKEIFESRNQTSHRWTGDVVHFFESQ